MKKKIKVLRIISLVSSQWAEYKVSVRTGIHLDAPGKKTSLDHFLVGIRIPDQVVLLLFLFTVVQTLSFVQLCDPMDCSTQGFLVFIISQSLLKLISIESIMPSNHFIFCHPLLLLPSVFSSIGVFSNESVLRIRYYFVIFKMGSIASSNLSLIPVHPLVNTFRGPLRLLYTNLNNPS